MNTSRNGMPHKLFPPLLDEDGKKICRYCRGKLEGRRTSWCSDECSTAAMVICYPSFARSEVQKRDKGICSTCGIDTVKLQRRFYKWIQRLRKRHLYKMAEGLAKRFRAKGWPCDWYGTRSWWDADHIIPVVEGGGGTGLENYRTLCVLCHKAETAALAARRAKAKRPQKEFTFEGTA